MSDQIKALIKCVTMDRPGHFQLTPSLVVCDWSGSTSDMFLITQGKSTKTACRNCGKVVIDGDKTDLFKGNNFDHLGPTRSKLHDEGREKYARDLYVYEDKRKPKKPRRPTGYE